jgi:competence protein ComEC
MQLRLAEIPSNHANNKQSLVLVKIEEPVQQNKKSFATLGRIKQWQSIDTIEKNKGFIRMHFPLSINKDMIAPNNWIVLYKTPQLIASQKNNGFDYKHYACIQHIYYQVYVQENDMELVKKEKVPLFTDLLFTTKNSIIKLLDQYIEGVQEAGIAEALLIGYKKNIDKPLLDAYSKTGIIHIIAISGMHLGMIYLLLLKLLYPLHKKKYYAIIEFILVTILIWLFTLLTGAAPSIVRAAIIFSCMSMGKLLKRKYNALNALAFAALCILFYNPLLIDDIGFQLSFAAVISIICFYLPIKKLLYIENKILILCWESTSITISAQILTLPLLLYHFHQFPIIFLLTNFIAIPISGVVLYLEILFLALTPIPQIASLLGKCIYLLLAWLNNWVAAMASLPFVSISNISITIPQTLAIYIFIIILNSFRREKYV